MGSEQACRPGGGIWAAWCRIHHSRSCIQPPQSHHCTSSWLSRVCSSHTGTHRSRGTGQHCWVRWAETDCMSLHVHIYKPGLAAKQLVGLCFASGSMLSLPARIIEPHICWLLFMINYEVSVDTEGASWKHSKGKTKPNQHLPQLQVST